VKQKLLTTVEVAAATLVPRATLQFWIRSGKISAPAIQLIDGKAARFWTPKQIQEIRNMKGSLQPGPKKVTRRRRAKRR
jgi:hypothetical protein